MEPLSTARRVRLPDSDTYTPLAKGLHWAIAALILGAYGAIYYREWLTDILAHDRIAIQLHYSCGITVFILVIVRIAWRWRHAPPPPKVDTAIHHRAIKVGHFALYAAMILMPVTGFLSVADFVASGKGHIDYWFFVELDMLRGIDPFAAVGLSLAWLEDPAHRIHAFLGAWIVWLLVAGHAAAAFYHQRVLRDGTLDRMTFSRR